MLIFEAERFFGAGVTRGAGITVAAYTGADCVVFFLELVEDRALDPLLPPLVLGCSG